LIILDENILDAQRLLLEASRIAVRQIGVDIGHKSLKNEKIVVLLRRQRNPTFFTRDAGFFLPIHRHRSYCLVLSRSGATALRRRSVNWNGAARRTTGCSNGGAPGEMSMPTPTPIPLWLPCLS
jgi:hypothetical protein